MLPTQKQLELRLLMTADPSVAHRAMQLLEGDAKRLDEAAKQAKRSLSDVGARQPGVLGRVGDGLAGAGSALVGAPGAAMGAAGTAAGWLAAGAAVASTISNMTHAVGQLDNELLTSRERVLGFARAIPVVGSALADLIGNAKDAIDRLNDPWTASRLDKDAIRIPVEMAQSDVEFGARRRGQELFREGRSALQRLESIQKYRTLDFRDQISLRTPDPIIGAAAAIAIGGYREVQDPRAKAAEDAVRMAERARAEASYGATSALSDAGHAERERDAAIKKFEAAKAWTDFQEKAAKDLGGDAQRFKNLVPRDAAGLIEAVTSLGTTPAANWLASRARPGANNQDLRLAPEAGTRLGYLDAINQETKAEQQAKQALQLLEERRNATKEKQLNLLQKEHELNKAITASKKVQLSLLDEEHARAKGGAQAFGAMSRTEQFDFLGAARRFRDGGRENVTGDELARLSANPITAGLVQDKLATDTKNDPQLQELLRLAGLRSAEEVAQVKNGLKVQVDSRVQLDEEQFARVVAEKFKELNPEIVSIIKKVLEIEVRGIERNAERSRLERGN